MLNTVCGQRSESMFVFVHTLTLTIPKKDPLRCISDGDMTSPRKISVYSEQTETPLIPCDKWSFLFWKWPHRLWDWKLPSWTVFLRAGCGRLQTLISQKRKRKKERIVWPGNTAYIQTEGKEDYVVTGRSGKPNEVHTYKSTAEFNRNGIKEKWRCRTYGHQLPNGVVVHKTRVCTRSL